jgi:CheY-like chemotaxis protein
VQLRVTDDGAGMTPEQLERLFEPFNRVGREHSGVEGTGIGLVVARGLVELMGGRLSVASAPGQGSEFTVELAAAHARSRPPAPGPSNTREAPPIRHDVCGRVLYIEDNEVNRELVQAYLARRPAVALALAVDGASGIEAAMTGPPDLVLLDMHLPDMSGIDVLRALRSQPSLAQVPCIALSASGMPEDIAAAQAHGLRAYLTKPLSASQLLHAVDAALSSCQARPNGPRRA